MMKTLEIASSKEIELIDITAGVQKAVAESGVGEGVCLVFCLHTTACLIVNENESGLAEDFEGMLARLIPAGKFQHNCVDDNARAHLTATLVGGSLMLPVHEGSLILGPFQSILFVELDGPRPRRSVAVQVLSSAAVPR